LKKIAFIVLLFSCSLSWTQEVVVLNFPAGKEATLSTEEYNALLNYTPKGFVANIKSKPQNRVLQGDLNTISSLELRYAYQAQLKLNATEIKWLEDEINALAVSFFKEGKPIIINRTGENGNCTGQGAEIEERGGFTVTVMNFCYTFPDGLAFENRFLELFNNRTEKLIAAKK
jgi:hypothetical protein